MRGDFFARGRDLGAWAFIPEHPLEGKSGGPLWGLTFSVKDLFQVQSWPTAASTHATLPPLEPSVVVQTLLERGASCVGKTHLHEIALGILGWNPVVGQARNPLDHECISGGSSSGAAISVALNECDFALGTDTGGSIRIPAALCGLVGFKPSHGHYPDAGVLNLSPTCDHVGTLARNVQTLIRVDEALWNRPIKKTALEPLRIGFWNVPQWTTLKVWESFSRVTDLMGAVPLDFPDVLETYSSIVQFEAARVHRAALERENPGFSAPILELLKRGQGIPQSRYLEAMKEREHFRVQLETLFAEFDVILAPGVPAVAPKIGVETLELSGGPSALRPAFLRLTAPFSLLGVPTVSLPLKIEMLSAGIQIVGRWGEDAKVLSVALELESRLSKL